MEHYLKSISQKYKDTQTSEMGYRTDFENLLETIFQREQKYHIHHDAKSIGGNKPDFVVLKDKVPVLYIENKDIGVDLNKIEKSNQIERYFGYDNLILTDQLEFRFYRNGQVYGEPIKIATYDKVSRIISPIPELFSLLEETILDFTLSHKEPIKRGKHLAQIMGGKAQRIRDNVREMLTADGVRYNELLNIKKVVTENLVAGLDDQTFADMYAQTLVYGLFAARYNDKTSENFSRTEARELVPRTNPFLHSFFDHIAGASFPDRLRFIVDELCEVFTHANVEKILHDFYGKEKENKDPIIHFYEDFLKEYDSRKKMEMGVFYTPRPVVQFIVRSVDEILKKDFGLPKGLGETAKVTIKRKEVYQAKKRTKAESEKDGKLIEVEKEYYKVQVLDVATGTGTFLNEVIAFVYKTFEGQEGRWDAYVKEHLLPRLHGFELMMASYTIAHLKLGMTLADTGVRGLDQRIGVYLTNTLEEPKDYSNQGTLFGLMDAIAEESKSASRIKSEYPIMCVIGNPPYSGISQNKEYTENSVYKVEPGGQIKLQERKHWLDDDYVKFIRFAEGLIEKNGEGVMGMITAHGYIDNPTFRGMRWHLRKTFDKIYIVDLHGNSNKKETVQDGSKDENVFDIKTGVSIILGVKNNTNKKDELAKVFKIDLQGLREDKFAKLDSGSVSGLLWQELPEEVEFWALEGEGKGEYEKGFSVVDVFPKNSTGIVTMGDSFIIDQDKKSLEERVDYFLQSDISESELKSKYGLGKNYGKWIVDNKRKIENNHSKIVPLSYRPFDNRYTYFDNNLVWRPRTDVMNHFVNKVNIGLVFARTQKNPIWDAVFISAHITETKLGEASTQSAVAPLYLYSEQNEKTPNLNKEIWNKINEVVGDTTPENILDYIYAVLHSPCYREKYKEFLKIDFPRVPYPEDKDKFWKLVELGTKLRELHVMISPEVNNIITTYPEAGTDMVDKVVFKDQKVYINNIQYFGNVPEIAWNFYIGGYQPAQKYLKDRKGQKLNNDEIEHYQRIIKVLSETHAIMAQIDVI